MILKIGNQHITDENNIMYLGTVIDSLLNWKSHISEKICRGIDILAKFRHYLSIDFTSSLPYNYLFTSYICCVNLGNTYITNLKRVIVLQKKALRVITFSDYRAHTTPLFKMHNVLKFVDIVKFYNGIFMFSYSTGLLPADFNDFFQ